jgi:hypothetical protein
MMYLYTKNPNLCLLWRALEWNMLVFIRYIMVIGNILLQFGIF